MGSPSRDLDARLIAPERAGMGGSSYQPRRRIIDCAAEVQDLAERLGLDRFAVVGYSGGGPYAAAPETRDLEHLWNAAAATRGGGEGGDPIA